MTFHTGNRGNVLQRAQGTSHAAQNFSNVSINNLWEIAEQEMKDEIFSSTMSATVAPINQESGSFLSPLHGGGIYSGRYNDMASIENRNLNSSMHHPSQTNWDGFNNFRHAMISSGLSRRVRNQAELFGIACPNKKNFHQADERPNLVDHTYADFSSVNDQLVHERSVFVGETLESIIDKGGATVPEDVVTVEPITNRGTRTFPKKLMEMLALPEVSHCLTWQPHGRSFVVNNPEAFMTEVYPQFFKATQYKSFLRQLNLWGFKRITKGPDSGSYYHQFFLRGMPNLVKKMTLVRIKGCVRAAPNPRDEPDFYALASLRPLPTI
eukprot:CAMPEP_0196808348 /NCGR_PEP_ID=MMETSP1362-20130617/8336_1 /TAXON_ID=163516 /ORGANISM="Leptocylindrus danicus, Strain CCMP1856" /LENGTH=323 /DNA_ID=CAMNT_0042182647 /DNA_START=28 /DNA_END=999 /DNA_ORIENTATION=-